ncbi:M20/M25/M40 family metallo-hydrolase [Flaviflexus huanghaiensis]|uniref:M20/M25/M40 family metallo-hydrolase n=1 Tax=Flaviflexus huanghaiensis TaxID=1111473 RepID=UPI0015FDD60E|nr:M20/M25/M40 family metallo-hydrolase [Flaviflexus huanghaiensis]
MAVDPSALDTSGVAQLCADLIRIDTSNFGDDPRTKPERPAADFVVNFLNRYGYDPILIESKPGRANVILRVPGTDPELPALVVHGHLDVVPAVAADWTVDPFAGVMKDGYLWGRGAVDMKNMDAMMLTVLADMKERNWRPKRDLIVAFFADEEAGGEWGAQWMAEHHPDLFDGATAAISEVGGYSVDVEGQTVYLIQTGEKGMDWLTLTARGRAGHGSQVNEDNAITKLAAAVARIGQQQWPLHLTDTVRSLLTTVSELTGLPFTEDPAHLSALVDALGPAAPFVGATLKTQANPTQLDGGYKANVIPATATAAVDMRPIPGTEDEAHKIIDDLAGPDVDVSSLVRYDGYEVPFDAPIVERMSEALLAEDPDAIVAPYLLSAGTDNKQLLPLGIEGYGFVPLALPADFNFSAMFHGNDERVPISALKFGTRVLARFLAQ